MAEDGEGRERGTDELFEDLDKFFAPIEEVDWPEGEGQAPSRAQEARPGAPPGERPSEPVATGEPASTGFPDAEPSSEVATTDEPAVPAGVDQPTQEMSADEWDDLRARFGQGGGLDDDEGRPEEEREAIPPGGRDSYSFMQQFLPQEGEEGATEAGEPAGEAPASGGTAGDEVAGAGVTEAAETGWAPDETEEVELEPAVPSLEDMRRAPDEYQDLPGPGEEAATPELDDDEVSASLWDEAEEPDAAAGEEPEEPLAVVTVTPEEEPPPGGVEAAAEHFAEAIRESGELPVISIRADDEAEGIEPGPEPLGDDLASGFEQEPPVPRTIKVGASDVGPSWQEPTSAEVATEAELEPAPPGRNVPMAFLVGAGLAVVGLGALAISKAAFTVVAGIIVLVAQMEMYAAVRRRNYHPAVPVGLAFGVLTIAAAYLKGESAMLAMIALSVPFTFLWFMAMPASRRRNAVGNIAMTLFPLLYVPFLAGFLLMTLAASKVLMISVLGLAVGYDVAAFAIGSWFGERTLAPSISPSKTWEGLVGATLVIVLVSVVFLASLDAIGTLMRALGLAIVVSIFAPLGDLSESLMKRDLGIKDMGSILPGHGGVLDRIDSVLLVAPAAWYFFRVFF